MLHGAGTSGFKWSNIKWLIQLELLIEVVSPFFSIVPTKL